MKRIALASLLALASLVVARSASATTYYVRPDGGSAAQCTGLGDRAYDPALADGQDCAFSHPFFALPPEGAPASAFAGGDTLVIAVGEYLIGIGAPNTEACNTAWAYDCAPRPVPSGPDAAHPTRIVGAGAASGCTERPQLHGAERVSYLLSLEGSSNVEVSCLELTDHSDCVVFHGGAIRCERDSSPYGPWGATGIVASDSSSVLLRDLDIHGLAHTGIHAGRLTDWTLEDVRIAANGWVGWDGDIAGDDSNTGTLTFRRWTVEWNGCGETYPGLEPTGCWGQSAGGYGDGVGTGATGGRWVIEDSRFLHNTSDGLDLLYLRGDTEVVLERVHAEGNGGNQIKTNGPVTMRNNVVIGNCGFFEGQAFTHHVDPCRALGNAVSLGLGAGTQASLINNTIVSEGDCALLISGSSCDGTERVTSRNNIFVGLTDFHQPLEQSCFMYNDGCTGDPFDHSAGVLFGLKGDPCPADDDLCVDPMFVSTGPTWDTQLRLGSPAIDTGVAGTDVPAVDIVGEARPIGAGIDRGAFETPLDGPRPDAGGPPVARDGGEPSLDGGSPRDASVRPGNDAGVEVSPSDASTGPDAGGGEDASGCAIGRGRDRGVPWVFVVIAALVGVRRRVWTVV